MLNGGFVESLQTLKFGSGVPCSYASEILSVDKGKRLLVILKSLDDQAGGNAVLLFDPCDKSETILLDSVKIFDQALESQTCLISTSAGLFLMDYRNGYRAVKLPLFTQTTDGWIHGKKDWLLYEEFGFSKSLQVCSNFGVFLSTNYENVEHVSTGSGLIRYAFVDGQIPRYRVYMVDFSNVSTRLLLDLENSYLIHMSISNCSNFVLLAFMDRSQRNMRLISYSIAQNSSSVVYETRDIYFYQNLLLHFSSDILICYFDCFTILRRVSGTKWNSTKKPEFGNTVKFIGSIKSHTFIFIINTGFRHQLVGYNLAQDSFHSILDGDFHCSNATILNDLDLVVEISSLNSSSFEYLLIDLNDMRRLDVIIKTKDNQPTLCNSAKLESEPAFPQSLVDILNYPIRNKRNLFQLDGALSTIKGILSFPHSFNPLLKYPLVFNVYGGPRVQYVLDSHTSSYPSDTEWLNENGFICVTIDGTGSFNHGIEEEDKLRRFGLSEGIIADHVLVTEKLKKASFIDDKKIFLHGWSFGGFLSMTLACRFPFHFKALVIGAPVIIWSLYDAAYTERYFGSQISNPSGYGKVKVQLTQDFISRFHGKIGIVVGLLDENVLPEHGLTLSQLLSHAGCNHQRILFEDEGHGLHKHDNKLIFFDLLRRIFA